MFPDPQFLYQPDNFNIKDAPIAQLLRLNGNY